MNDYTFKQAEALVRYYFELHEREKIKNKMSPNKNYEIFNDIFMQALNSLDDDAKEIIINEFENHYPRLWWQDYYSKTNYYMVKGRGMRVFLEKLRW